MKFTHYGVEYDTNKKGWTWDRFFIDNAVTDEFLRVHENDINWYTPAVWIYQNIPSDLVKKHFKEIQAKYCSYQEGFLLLEVTKEDVEEALERYYDDLSDRFRKMILKIIDENGGESIRWDKLIRRFISPDRKNRSYILMELLNYYVKALLMK